MPGETFTLNSDDFETTRYLGSTVTRGHSKTSETTCMSLNGWARFRLMLIVTRVTPGTVDVKT